MARYSTPAPGDQLLYRLPDGGSSRIAATRPVRSPAYATRRTSNGVPDYRDPYADMPVSSYSAPSDSYADYGDYQRDPPVYADAGSYPPAPAYAQPQSAYPQQAYDGNSYYAPSPAYPANPTYPANNGYGSYQSAPLPPVQPAPAYSQQSTYSAPPPGTLEAQARVVDRGGRSPVASAPLARSTPAAPPRRQAERSPALKATAPATRPRAPQQTAASAQQAAAAPSDQAARARQLSPSASPQPLQRQAEENAALPPAGTTVGSIRFLPIIGAPVEAVTPLSRQLGVSARASGLTIRASTDTSSEHILKGYLSAVAEDGQLTVNYVWDVLDSRGNRLNRIQGQERVAYSGGDPWAAVPPETMRAIAQKTIASYMDWREGLQG
ncbi:hypothetical protein [Rhizobium sp. CSW-27]|uniref:hypothetical protein n=1 Tax=Rhizobium sp. CSW-27 TaxID=2839985 RepID=UPI001C02F1BB|nr:hypothetical protein [Rhizobium sp. CSW-27]MBT9372496.1 hypothetical protein [Rhizobium sp. CSW-27]